MKIAKLLACATAAFACGAVHAATIDFQDVPSGTCALLGSQVTSRGFVFAGNPRGTGLFVCDPGVLQQNPSPALIDANLGSVITMAPVAGTAFSLDSFFAGGRTGDFAPLAPADGAYGVATGIDVVGHLLGGGTVRTTFALPAAAPYPWQQFVLPDTFSNLGSVELRALGSPNPEFLIDDIVVDSRRKTASSNVPEPGTLTLLAAGSLLTVVVLRRRG